MVTQKEKAKLIEHFKEKYPETADMVDLEMEVDSELNFSENKDHIQNIFDKIESESIQDQMKNYKEQINMAEQENKKQIQSIEENELEEDWKLWERVLPEVKSIVTLGTTGSGKTAHSFKILETAKRVLPDRKIFVFKHPKPKLVEKAGFLNLYNIEQIDRLNNAVIYVDEPQNSFKLYDHRQNEMLAKLLALARQRDILLIISTSMTHWVTRLLEGGVDVYCVKDIDYDSVKQGSRIKVVIKQNSMIDPSFFKLEPDEYLFYCRKFPEYSMKHRFVKPVWFDDSYSKPYAVESKSPTETPIKVRQELRQMIKSDNKKAVGMEA